VRQRNRLAAVITSPKHAKAEGSEFRGPIVAPVLRNPVGGPQSGGCRRSRHDVKQAAARGRRARASVKRSAGCAGCSRAPEYGRYQPPRASVKKRTISALGRDRHRGGRISQKPRPAPEVKEKGLSASRPHARHSSVRVTAKGDIPYKYACGRNAFGEDTWCRGKKIFWQIRATTAIAAHPREPRPGSSRTGELGELHHGYLPGGEPMTSTKVSEFRSRGVASRVANYFFSTASEKCQLTARPGARRGSGATAPTAHPARSTAIASRRRAGAQGRARRTVAPPTSSEWACSRTCTSGTT